MPDNFIRYTVHCKHPHAHIFEISCTVNSPVTTGQVFSLPNWIPGSYMIRDFAKNIIEITASSNDSAINLKKLDKNSWRCAATQAPITIVYTVYAYDLSVRAAYLDSSHAFFNGTSLFLLAHGHEDKKCLLEIIKPSDKHYSKWRIATTLSTTNIGDFGDYFAECYDDLIDHPVEMGDFSLIQFTANDVPHEMAISGQHKTDIDKLSNDLIRICNTHGKLFGELPDMQRYLFLTTVINMGYGGLEHRSSSSLLCSTKDLLNDPKKDMSNEYRQFLALCSHEYFHSWNIKRIKPDSFIPYDLQSEVHTEQLWAFEGITSYYDELALVRCGVISVDSYLELLSQTITRVTRQTGRFKQSVVESSFDTWTKFYKQDENATNAIVSYYTKGALIALYLDFTLRQQTQNKMSLDDVMRYLWQEYGKKNQGLKEREIESIIQKLSQLDLSDLFNRYLYGIEDPPLEEIFAIAGIHIEFRAAENQNDLGGKNINKNKINAVSLGIRSKVVNNMLVVQQVYDNSSAQNAGLSCGDEIISFDAHKVSPTNLQSLMSSCLVDDSVEILVFRRCELHKFTVTLQQRPMDTCVLSMLENQTDEQATFRKSWLHQ